MALILAGGGGGSEDNEDMKKGESMSLAVPAVALEVLGALVVVVVVEVLGSGDEFFLAGNSVGMGRTWPRPLYERDGSLLWRPCRLFPAAC